MNDAVSEEKEQLRSKIWTLMEQKRVAIFPLPVFGRIPNFVGSDKAASLVRTLPEWKAAKVVFANPDYAQKKVREFALKEAKTVIMASPGLKHGFLRIDPNKVKGNEEIASSIKGAFRYGKPVQKMIKPDMIITGCVAVDLSGWRLGKGGGYGDIEVQRIKDEFGKIPVIATVHPLQVVELVPHLEHDAKVNIIVTPEKFFRIEQS